MVLPGPDMSREILGLADVHVAHELERIARLRMNVRRRATDASRPVSQLPDQEKEPQAIRRRTRGPSIPSAIQAASASHGATRSAVLDAAGVKVGNNDTTAVVP